MTAAQQTGLAVFLAVLGIAGVVFGYVQYRGLQDEPDDAEPTPPTPHHRLGLAYALAGVASIVAGIVLAVPLVTGAYAPVAAPGPAPAAQKPRPEPNLIPNDSVEKSDESGDPVAWRTDEWGDHDATYEYAMPGRTGSRSFIVRMTKHTDGDAKWRHEPRPVTPGDYYQYTDFYISDVITHVAVAFWDSSGNVSFKALKDAPASRVWSIYRDGFTVPEGVTMASVYHVLATPGSLQTDDFTLRRTPEPSQFTRGIVSLTFDDGWDTDFTNALPVLKEHQVKATHYIISGFIGDTDEGYMTAEQIMALVEYGAEIGSHTVTHPRLTQVDASRVATEMADSRETLEALVGKPVTEFAYPWGDHDAQVMDQAREQYGSARTTISGENTPSGYDPHRIVMMPVDGHTSMAEIKEWVDSAEQNKHWLVLMYHRIDTDGHDASVTPKSLGAAIEYIKSTGVPILPVGEARAELEPQLKQ